MRVSVPLLSSIFLSGILAVACTTHNLLSLPSGESRATIAYNQEGIRYFQAGELSMARQALENALAEDALLAEVHYNLAVTLEHQGHNRAAEHHYFEAANLAPGHKVIWNSPPLRSYESARVRFLQLPKYLPKFSPFQNPYIPSTTLGRTGLPNWDADLHQGEQRNR